MPKSKKSTKVSPISKLKSFLTRKDGGEKKAEENLLGTTKIDPAELGDQAVYFDELERTTYETDTLDGTQPCDELGRPLVLDKPDDNGGVV